MKLLLDTQALLWWLGDSAQLSEAARSAIGDGNNGVFVSAASAWEMEIKRALGKLRTPENLEETLTQERFVELPVRFAHTAALRALPGLHRDPFDRLLIAQATVEGLTIVTSDRTFARYQVPVLAT
ncbi:MAG TPA: type II toxin-antitoxin system VapC family toxin [Verrucomicrobiota bacterium]|nr:type II toxin-antitoxin system VapC family toxin [Verrucomicrobiota bacterium]HRZ38911.1 type II toxin-antitoxin system VapC family toxin [Candidatus Paceibacterota bacterium]